MRNSQAYQASTIYYEALNRYQPDTVVVSNPTAYHLDVVIPAAKAGCHLLLEKPISHNMKSVSRLGSIIAQKKLKVVVGFQFRFHPSLGAVRNLLCEGAIGPVTYPLFPPAQRSVF